MRELNAVLAVINVSALDDEIISRAVLGSTTAYLLRNIQADILIYIPINQEE